MSDYPAIDDFMKYLKSDYEKRAKTMPPVKYDYNDTVSFKLDDQVKTGTVFVVDRYGTFEQSEEPSYDVLVESENILYKHIRQSWIVEKGEQNG